MQGFASHDHLGFDDRTDPLLARTIEEFHWLLLMGPTVGYGPEHGDPVEVFVRFADQDPDTAVAVAALILTEPRWCDGTAALAERITDTGVLDGERATELTEVLAAGSVDVVVPEHWFTGTVVVIPPEGEGEAVADSPDLVRRVVPVAVRGWARSRSERVLGGAPAVTLRLP